MKRLANGPPSLPVRACEQALHAIGRRFACRFHQLPAVFALDQTQPAFQRAPHSLVGSDRAKRGPIRCSISFRSAPHCCAWVEAPLLAMICLLVGFRSSSRIS